MFLRLCLLHLLPERKMADHNGPSGSAVPDSIAEATRRAQEASDDKILYRGQLMWFFFFLLTDCGKVCCWSLQ